MELMKLRWQLRQARRKIAELETRLNAGTEDSDEAEESTAQSSPADGPLQSEDEIRKRLDQFLAYYGIEPEKPVELGKFQDSYYAHIPVPVRWHVAEEICEVLGGHLACVTSPEENAFVGGLGPGFWLGLTDQETEGEWEWVTGETVEFEGWGGQEPTNSHGLEHWAVFEGYWWDVMDDQRQLVCEWDGRVIDGASRTLSFYSEWHLRSALMTDARRQEYVRQLRGRKVRGRAVVQDVKALGETAEIRGSLFGSRRAHWDVSLKVPAKIALPLKKGQDISFEGRVETIDIHPHLPILWRVTLSRVRPR
jgi:hypothetical protein